MADRDYEAEARHAVMTEEAARVEGLITSRAASLRQADETAALHAAVRAKHGLPDHATPRQMANAERAYAAAWTSFVASRYGGSAMSVQVLDPQTHVTDPARVSELLALRAKLRKQFEATWPPADLAAQIGEGTTDGVRQHYGHNIATAA